MNAETKHSGPVDVLAWLDGVVAGSESMDRASGIGPSSQTTRARIVRSAVAELIEAAANVVADIRANKEPDLIALADCIKTAGGRDVLKAALSKVEGKTYTLADHANIRSAP